MSANRLAKKPCPLSQFLLHMTVGSLAAGAVRRNEDPISQCLLIDVLAWGTKPDTQGRDPLQSAEGSTLV